MRTPTTDIPLIDAPRPPRRDLDRTVHRAAQLLRDVYGSEVAVRYNADRQAGGAWLHAGAITAEDLGICACLVTEELVAHRVRAGLGAAGLVVGDVHVFAHLHQRVLADPTVRRLSGWRDGACGADPHYRGRHPSVEDALAFLLQAGAVSPH